MYYYYYYYYYSCFCAYVSFLDSNLFSDVWLSLCIKCSSIIFEELKLNKVNKYALISYQLMGVGYKIIISVSAYHEMIVDTALYLGPSQICSLGVVIFSFGNFQFYCFIGNFVLLFVASRK